MTNNYFNHDNEIARQTLGRSGAVNALFRGIASGFDKIPAPNILTRYMANFGPDIGTSNSYRVDLTPPLTAYEEGQQIRMKIANTNTSSATLDVNGLGPRSIKRWDGSDVEAGDLTEGDIPEFTFDGTHMRMNSPSRRLMAGMMNTLGADLVFKGLIRFAKNIQAPAFVFLDDPDTGLRRAGPDDIAVVAGGADQLRLKAGVASGEAVQSSPADDTPGKVMTVGAFGLGAIDLQITNLVADADDTSLALGFYAVTAATSGDVPTTFGVLHVVPLKTSLGVGIDQITQKFWPTGAVAREYLRFYREGLGWTPWSETIHQGNILGQVSHSNGVPTGAIIERGSNPSGSFVRFADGTQICTHFISSSNSEGVTWVFPAPFASSSVALSAVGVFASAARTATFGSISSSSAVLHGWTSAGGRTALTFLVTAIGQWK